MVRFGRYDIRQCVKKTEISKEEFRYCLTVVEIRHFVLQQGGYLASSIYRLHSGIKAAGTNIPGPISASGAKLEQTCLRLVWQGIGPIAVKRTNNASQDPLVTTRSTNAL